MDEQQEQKLSRALKSRHITMIAIGGAIGTGAVLRFGDGHSRCGSFNHFILPDRGDLLLLYDAGLG